MATLSAEAIVRLAAQAALDKKALDLTVLDLQGLSSIADFFLICSARSTTQASTIAEAARIALRSEGVRPRHTEGSAESGWLLLDYGDVVIHVFMEATRGFYALERLWGDAPLLSVER
ncbi:MAG TPA: ribosome silencing factor [Methylomirabilota bacterium]|jgi:ribosome-associated protein|nr:ribosome silencing factor [Methylomirabilota bacterium]